MAGRACSTSLVAVEILALATLVSGAVLMVTGGLRARAAALDPFGLWSNPEIRLILGISALVSGVTTFALCRIGREVIRLRVVPERQTEVLERLVTGDRHAMRDRRDPPPGRHPGS